MPDRYVAGARAGYGYAVPGQDSRLRGTGRLADDLWLLAHDDRTGKCRIRPRPLGLGLAGGLLCELLLAGQAGVTRDGLIIAGATPAPDPRALYGSLLRLIVSEPGLLPVRDWIRFISQSSAREVAARLELDGYLTVTRRRVPGLPDRRAPRNPDWAITPISRAGAALDPRRAPDRYAGSLAGLAAACGLGFRLDQYLRAGRTVQEASLSLPPGLRLLITETEVTVSAAVHSSRT